MILVFTELAGDGLPTEISRQALTSARNLASRISEIVHAVVVAAGSTGSFPGDAAPTAADAVAAVQDSGGAAALAALGVEVVHVAHDPHLRDYGPEAWGESLAAAIAALRPVAVVAGGSDRGAEVMAQAAAIRDLPLVANVIELREVPPEGGWAFTRVRWGGSLLDHAALEADVRMLTIQPHVVEPTTVAGAVPEPKVEALAVGLDPTVARSLVVDRTVTSTGVTLAEAPVVVGGGRGVGSPEGFGPLEELAELLGGRVGCSRVVTNNGWRPHADQVGQTGTAIAPEIYIACGISGAIQHWAGAKGAKTVLAVNTDPDANMVSRADYAVIADLHEVIPALVTAIRARRGA